MPGIVVEAPRPVPGSGVDAEAPQRLLRAIGQHVGGERHRHPLNQVGADEEVQAVEQRKAGNRGHQPRQGDRRPQRAFLAGRGHHLRGRGLAGGEGRLQRITPGQRRAQRGGRGRPPARVLLQAPEDRPLDGGLEPRDELRRRQRARLEVGPEHGGARGGGEGGPAGEDLVEDEAERVQVAARGDLAADRLLRRHVRGRPEPRRPARSRGRPRASPKSVMRTRPWPSSMTFAGLRSRWMTPGCARPRAPRRAAGRCRGPCPEAGGRSAAAARPGPRRPRTPWSGTSAVGLADVVDAADVGMRDLPGQADLVPKPLEAGRSPATSGGSSFSATVCPRRRSSAR